MIPKQQQLQVLDDIDVLQLSQSPEIFDRASKMFLKKYEHFKDFVAYFDSEWLQLNRNWFEGASLNFAPSTNNAHESFNRVFKDEKTMRERFPLEMFIAVLMKWISEWGAEYDAGTNIFATSPSLDLPLWTKAYQWVRLNKNIKVNVAENFYWVPAGEAKDIVQFLNSETWTQFDDFKSNAFRVWATAIIDRDSWIESKCNCPAFMKKFMCKHILGIAIRLKYCCVPQEAKNLPIGSKRKRGRPAKAKKALLVQ